MASEDAKTMASDPATANMADEPADLVGLIDRIELLAERKDEVSIDSVMQTVGPRSFGPLVLTVGLILASPLSGIPALPSLLAFFILLVATQMVLGWHHFWLPRWVLKRSVAAERLRKALTFLRRPARWVDKPLRPRLTWLTHERGARAAAGVCLLIAVVIPPLELVPFSSSVAGVAMAAFGLSLITHDGLLAVLAYVLVAVAIALTIGLAV